jgi:hypothetical protein
MCHNIATDRLLGVRIEHTCCTIDLRDDLVGNDNSDAKLKKKKGERQRLNNDRQTYTD